MAGGDIFTIALRAKCCHSPFRPCKPCHVFHVSNGLQWLCFYAGNLLVLRDGRVGFIDFGIVGKISPLTFQALQAFLVSSMSADYDTMAKALITMGVTEETVIVEVCCGQRVMSDCVLMQHLLATKTCIISY